MVLFRNTWIGYFRSPDNRFEAFGEFDSALLDFENFTTGGPNVSFEVSGFSSELISETSLPEIGIFIGLQSREGLAFVRGGDPRILATNLRFVPEPMTASLLALCSLCFAMSRRRA
jgi:hypothetical protein